MGTLKEAAARGHVEGKRAGSGFRLGTGIRCTFDDLCHDDMPSRELFSSPQGCEAGGDLHRLRDELTLSHMYTFWSRSLQS